MRRSAETWMCLYCGKLLCGVFIPGAHIAEHTEETSGEHCLYFAPRSQRIHCVNCHCDVDLTLASDAERARVLAFAHRLRLAVAPCEADLSPLYRAWRETPHCFPVPEGASQRDWHDLASCVRGLLVGQAVGDAVGLPAEFTQRARACELCPVSLQLGVSDGTSGGPGVFEPGDWTDDTDQLLLLLEALLARGLPLDTQHFAARLTTWAKRGYPQLGDTCGLGCGSTVGSVLAEPGFLDDPHRAAQAIYDESGRRGAANGALMRTAVLGVPHFHDADAVADNTLRACCVTHAGALCKASCLTATLLVARMLAAPVPDGDARDLVVECVEDAIARLGEELSAAEGDEVRTHALADDLDALNLDDRYTMGYTLKCLGAACWALRQGSFEAAITEVVRQGGDADTNAAVAGALLGCRLGVEAIPLRWREALINAPFLDERADAFLAALDLAP